MRNVAKVVVLLLVPALFGACGGKEFEVVTVPAPAGAAGGSDGRDGGAGSGGRVEEPEPSPRALESLEVIGDPESETLVVRGRGLRGAKVFLEQGGGQHEMEVVASEDEYLRVAVPTVAEPGAATILVRAAAGNVRREVVLLRGPAGAVGAAGPQGAQGPRGEKGEKGEKGDRGEKGERGEVGPQGPQGPQGPRGAMGAVGLTGLQGPRGDKGDRGDQGPKGDRGATGPQGPRGPQGDDGVLGIDTLVLGTGTVTIATNSDWARVGGSRTVTVGKSSTLLVLADVGEGERNVYHSGQVQMGIRVDGGSVLGYFNVPSDGNRRTAFFTRAVGAGNHTIELVARCVAGSGICTGLRVPVSGQRLLVLQLDE